jgi:glutamate racemase
LRIGVFDSGIGGLTVFSTLHRALPLHDLIYLGDTARVPYGTRSSDTVIRYSRRVASYLSRLDVDLIVIACNTATTHALPLLKEAGAKVGIEVYGVIESGIQTALKTPNLKSLAILGTAGTIEGGAYQKRLRVLAPQLRVTAIACPLFVPLAEEGWLEGDVPTLIAERYLSELRGQVDTVILGCTHYPLLKTTLRSVLPGIRLVDSAAAIADDLANTLPNSTASAGSRRFFVTDHLERFKTIGAHFLGWTPEPIEWVDLGPAVGPFALQEPT